MCRQYLLNLSASPFTTLAINDSTYYLDEQFIKLFVRPEIPRFMRTEFVDSSGKVLI